MYPTMLYLLFMAKHCVYKITNNINGKVYIGQTNNFKRRIRDHTPPYRDNSPHPLYNSIRKYGWENFFIEILFDNIDSANIDDLEQWAISEYKATNRTYGYNIDIGGSKQVRPACNRGKSGTFLGRKHTKESRRKMSKNSIGQGGGFTGRKHTEESKRKIGESSKGRVFPNEAKQKISQLHKGINKSKEHNLKVSMSKLKMHPLEFHILVRLFLRSGKSANKVSQVLKRDYRTIRKYKQLSKFIGAI